MAIVRISDELYLKSVNKIISTENMGDMIEYALRVALNTRLSKCKTAGARARLFASLEQGRWWACRPTFADKINAMEMFDLVAMLSPAQRQTLINVLKD